MLYQLFKLRVDFNAVNNTKVCYMKEQSNLEPNSSSLVVDRTKVLGK